MIDRRKLFARDRYNSWNLNSMLVSISDFFTNSLISKGEEGMSKFFLRADLNSELDSMILGQVEIDWSNPVCEVI